MSIQYACLVEPRKYAQPYLETETHKLYYDGYEQQRSTNAEGG